MRWYDRDEALRSCLDGLRFLPPRARRQAVAAAIDTIEAQVPGFIDEHVDGFDLPAHGRRRWYDDDDPETWMLFHGLELADVEVRRAVVVVLIDRVVMPAA